MPRFTRLASRAEEAHALQCPAAMSVELGSSSRSVWTLHRRFFEAVSNVTIGTVIVMTHMVLAERARVKHAASNATPRSPAV